MTDNSVLHIAIKITGIVFVYMAVTGALGIGIAAPLELIMKTVNNLGMRIYRLQDNAGTNGALLATWLMASALLAARFER